MYIRVFIILFAGLYFFSSCNPTQSSTKTADDKSMDQVIEKAGIKPNVRKEIKQDNITKKSVSMSLKTLDEVMGKFDPSSHPDFVIIDKKYADQQGRIMQKQAYQSFITMFEAAQKDGIQLVIKSATRNFNYQKGIWERKWTGKTKVKGKDLSISIDNHTHRAEKILEYSSMPGTSRHHWGTDIDLNAFENSYFESGKGKDIYHWLQAHASEYGFCQPYTKKGMERPFGYNEEKWHWSYLPVANQYMGQAQKSMNDQLIQGFLGSETAVEIGVVEKYVFGINHACKNETNQ